ncbi:MAG: phosphate ABC transporter substrate-binding/OmpA family protein [Desulfobacterales bacterium]|nr:phosphate ABC transporter substrate-binding/OmpA family protein [Desulfobacterales bacterium]MBF0396908.1 phosphate ABC transporter substrate-binding/OmpA family protein [Desulfobacterales bacterium]
MAIRSGRCTKFGECSLADNKMQQSVPEGSDILCQECGGRLVLSSDSKSSNGIILLLVIILALGGIVFGAIKIFSSKKSTVSQPVAVSTIIATTTIPAPQSAPPPKVEQKEEIILRLHGSETIGGNMAIELADAFLAKEGGTNIQKVLTDDPKQRYIKASFGDKIKVIEIKFYGSSTAFTDILEQKADIGMASRRVKEKEIAELKNAGIGDMVSPECEYVIAMDAVAVLVNRVNPVKSLTKAQLLDIFSGKITDWEQVKGTQGKIKLYARDKKAGAYEIFASSIMKDVPFAASTEIIPDSSVLSDKVAGDPMAIGFAGLPFVRSARALEIADTGAISRLPTPFNIAREDYLLSRRLYLYTQQLPKNPFTLKFIDFTLSKQGQEIVQKSGFVDLTIIPEKKEVVQKVVKKGFKDRYEEITANALQLSTNFRFETGKDILDTKATRDLDRISETMNEPENRNKSFYLLGFADNRGKEQTNILLSRSRALTVSEELKKRGLIGKIVEGFGSKRPVASNDNEEGREKNRRVEIWIDN